MPQNFKYLAVTCASKMEALTLVYLAVCCHLTNVQLRARKSPVSERAADLQWPTDLDEDLILQAGTRIRIELIQRFDCNDAFPDPEAMRTEVLAELRAGMAA